MTFIKIWAVAHYEAKSLMRSKVFIIYSFTACLFLLINSALLTDEWNARCIPSLIPYIFSNSFIIVQAVIGVLLASEFLAGEIKLNSIDSIHARSLTNAGYIIGKSLGIFAVFFIVNIFYFLCGVIINIVFFSDTSVNLVCYLYYPLLLTMPTIIFIIGLSLMLTALFRIRAITIIIMLGYIAIAMIFIGDNYNYLFDFLGRRIPFVYSDFTGFGNLPLLICQRLIYFLSGLSCIFITVLLLKRLPQSKTANRLSIVFAVLCIIGTVHLYFRFHDTISSGIALRRDINELNKHSAEKPQVSVTDCDLDLIHHGDEIEVEAKIKVKNLNNFPVDQLIFSLNPGLEVIKVESDGKGLNYERNLHILSVEPSGKILQSNKTDSLVICYKGIINEEACYTVIDENERKVRNMLNIFTIEKRYSFIASDYVLLTHENLWYPVAGIPCDQGIKKGFVNYRLSVTTDRALTAVSQGISVKTDDGKFTFTPEEPLPQLSLVIGDYVKKSITVDDIEYAVYVKDGHDYFSRHFKNIGDKLPETINKIKQEFEFRINIDYPFPRFSFVEVPVQFFAYQSEWGLCPATVQPEQIFIAEQGAYFQNGDFEYVYRVVSGRLRRSNSSRSPRDIESAMLQYFAKYNFIDVSTQRLIAGFRKENNSGAGLTADKLGLGSPYPLLECNYNLFPNYYCYTNYMTSDRFPVLDSVIGHYLKSKLVHHNIAGFHNKRYIPHKTKAVIALSQKSLKEIIADTESKSIVNEVLKIKADYLFMYIFSKSGIDKEEFESFLTGFLSENRFRTVDLNDFNDAIKKQFGIDFESFLDNWYHQKKLPGYEAYDIKYTEVYDNEKIKYQVYFTLHNISDVDGVVYAMMDNQGIIGERYVYLKGHQTKLIGMVLDREPVYGIRIDPFISQHYFYIDNFLDTYRADKNAVLFDGERVINFPVKSGPTEIVVDNLEPGFKILSQPEKRFLVKYLFKNKFDDINKFKAFNKRNTPGKWTYGFDEQFYGNPETSAFYIRSGTGKCKVEWKAEIPENGNYDIYYYTPHHRKFRIWGKEKMFACTDFNFLVHHDEGVDEVTMDISNTEKAWTNIGNYKLKGWTFLGTYYLSEGTAKVELTDKSKGKLVYADAVKWVKK